jgi:hypothetical protein
MVIKYKSIYRKKCFNNPLFLLLKVSGLFLFQKSLHFFILTVVGSVNISMTLRFSVCVIFILTVVGSVNISMTLRFGVCGIFLVFSSLNQFLFRTLLKSWLNGPEYDRKAVLINTSPTSL